MNNFNNFLNHLNSFTKKQPIREQQYPNPSSGTAIGNIGIGALGGAAVGGILANLPGALVGGAIGGIGGLASNSIPSVNINGKKVGVVGGGKRQEELFQQETQEEERKRLEDVSKANPDLAARMQEDPRNRPGIGMGIARAMNDMSRMQTKVNAASRNLNNLQNPLKEMFNFSYNVEKRHATRQTHHADPAVAMAALNSPDATNETTLVYAKHADPQVAITALNHPMATSQTVDIASTHPDASVVMAALNNPMATSYTTHNAVGHPNPAVAMAALNHPEADGGTIMYGKQHPDSKVVAAAIGHLTNDDQIMKREIENGNFMYLNHRLRGGKAPDSNPGSQNNPLSHPIQENTRRSIFLNHLNSFSK